MAPVSPGSFARVAPASRGLHALRRGVSKRRRTPTTARRRARAALVRQCGIFRHSPRPAVPTSSQRCARRDCVRSRRPRPARRLERRRFLQRRGGSRGRRRRASTVGRQGLYGVRHRWRRGIPLRQRGAGPAWDRASAHSVVLDAAADSRAEDARVEVRGGGRLFAVDRRRRPSGGRSRGKQPRPARDRRLHRKDDLRAALSRGPRGRPGAPLEARRWRRRGAHRRHAHRRGSESRSRAPEELGCPKIWAARRPRARAVPMPVRSHPLVPLACSARRRHRRRLRGRQRLLARG